MKIIRLIILLTLFALLYGCKKSGAKSGAVNIYVAGEELINGYYYGVYWLNGHLVSLENATDGTSGTASIAVSGHRVVVTGFGVKNSQFPLAYWDNGNIVTLTANGISQGYVAAGAFSSGHLYFAGNAFSAALGDFAAYWDNGQAVILPDHSLYCFASAIAVSGNDVYVAGRAGVGNHSVALYWKNGQEIFLSDTLHMSYTNSIAVDGNDVYVAGMISTKTNFAAVYWKNGNQVIIGDSAQSSAANSIAIWNNNVYCAGYADDSVVYWENGALNVLNPWGDPLLMNTIAVHNGDVYVAGNFKMGNVNYAAYWKNGGAPVILSSDTVSYAGASSIAVTSQ